MVPQFFSLPRISAPSFNRQGETTAGVPPESREPGQKGSLTKRPGTLRDPKSRPNNCRLPLYGGDFY